MITSEMFKRRPDQTAQQLNALMKELEGMKNSIKVMSEDGKNVIIIGVQPVNPATKKRWPFGIRTYEVKGDRLEEV